MCFNRTSVALQMHSFILYRRVQEKEHEIIEEVGSLAS